MKKKQDPQFGENIPKALQYKVDWAVFILAFIAYSFFFDYVYSTALINPYPFISFLIVVLFISFLASVPGLITYYFLKKKTEEALLLSVGSIVGIFIIYFVEAGGNPVMRIYVSLHDMLFNTFKINIYFLDYGGFGVMVAFFSSAFTAHLVNYIYTSQFKKK